MRGSDLPGVPATVVVRLGPGATPFLLETTDETGPKEGGPAIRLGPDHLGSWRSGALGGPWQGSDDGRARMTIRPGAVLVR